MPEEQTSLDIPENCQIFTPLEYTKEILNSIGYKKNLYGKKIIENACGDGNIIAEIVRRYIQDARRSGLTDSSIQQGLENDIVGYELDPNHRATCISTLNTLVNTYGINNVNWQIIQADFLKSNIGTTFDFVVGNPPYINYKRLTKETRSFLKENFTSCSSGPFDYCYPFVEKSLSILKNSGKMSYLIPASIFKNVYAAKLRTIIFPHLKEIHDYTNIKVFPNALVTPALLICHKNTKSKSLKFIQKQDQITLSILKSQLGSKWIFDDTDSFIKKNNRFGDYFDISLSIATLRNKVFVISEFEDHDTHIKTGNFYLEKKSLRLGSSPRTKSINKQEFIIFPYYYKDNELCRYSEEEYKHKFPRTFEYLRNHQKTLKKRDADKGAYWFEYGRSQALRHLNQPKLMISTIVTKRVKVYTLDTNEIPYSGFYIIPKRDKDLQYARNLLESKEFLLYAHKQGISASGHSFRITASDIKNFKF